MLGGMPVSFTTKHSLHVYHVLLSLRKNKIYFQSIVCIHDYHVCFQAFVKIKYRRVCKNIPSWVVCYAVDTLDHICVEP